MANSKISQLPSASALDIEMLFPVVDTIIAQTQKAKISQLVDLIENLIVIEPEQIESGSITIGTTNIIIGTTSSVLQNVQQITSSFITGSQISGSFSGSGTLINNLDASKINTGTLNTEFGGTGRNILNSGSLLIGNNINPVNFISPGTNGQILAVVNNEWKAADLNNILELTKLNVSSSVSLLTTQRAVFATNAISSSLTITLPSIVSADSREYYITKADSLIGSVIISGSGSDLINGQGTFALNGPYQSITLITDGTSWFIF